MACKYILDGKEYTEQEFKDLAQKEFVNRLKTRRVLEVQSDLFQKGRDKVDLISDQGIHIFPLPDNKGYGVYETKTNKLIKEFDDIMIANDYIVNSPLKDNANTSSNKFLQLLNKDGNWISFFIKSIVQDSAKKGYEVVLFPTGDTASLIEGHQTLEDFKKQKEDRIKELNKQLENTYGVADEQTAEMGAFAAVFKTKQEAHDYIEDYNLNTSPVQINHDATNREKQQLQEELKRVETEGFAALKPIYDFYENRVKNTLVKIYGKDNVKSITDEHGNTWNQVYIVQERDRLAIAYQKGESKQSPDKQLDAKLKSGFFRAIGVDVEHEVNTGQTYKGAVDTAKGIAKVVDGKADITTLAHEATHMMLDLLPDDSKLLSDILKDVKSKDVYDEIYDRYKDDKQYQNTDGTVNEDKIGKEVAAHIIDDIIVQKYQERSSMKWWERLWKWIQGLFKGQSLDSFEQVAEDVLAGKVDKLKLDKIAKAELAVAYHKPTIPGSIQGNGLRVGREPIDYQVSQVQKVIRNSLPVEISSVINVVKDVPIDILGRNDLFLSLKDILNDNGINDELLINWAGINRVNPKAIKSTEQLSKIVQSSYDKLKKTESHPELKSNNLALDSFHNWVNALERYPVAFRDMMLNHAIKQLNPQRRSKYVLQLSSAALASTYGIVVNKPHELNRIGKLYDQEVLKTVSDAVGHEPSASGNGYWVHIPRISALSQKENTPYSGNIVEDSFIKPHLTINNQNAVHINNIQYLKNPITERWHEPFTAPSQYKVNVELLRKLSPSTWCTASGMAGHYVENYDNYLLVVNNITVAGIEAGDIGPNGKIQVKEVTSRANNGVASIDHIDDITAFFEKHNLDTNNNTLKRAQKAKLEGKVDKDIISYDGYDPNEMDGGQYMDWNHDWDNEMEDRGDVDDPGQEYRDEEIHRNLIQIVENVETPAEALRLIEQNVPILYHFSQLQQQVRNNEEVANKAITVNAHNIAYISSTVPFYEELATRAVRQYPPVFNYLPTEFRETHPEIRDIYNNHQQDDLPFSKTNTNQVQGYYDPKSDKVVVVAANTPVDQAAKVGIHEVAHRGMVRMARDLGGTKELNQALFAAEKQLMEKASELLKRTGHKSIEALINDYGFDANSEEGKAKLLTELVARWAETLVDKPKPSWWKSFLETIKNWIKKFTGKVLNEEEVNELVGGFVRYGTEEHKSTNVNFPIGGEQRKIYEKTTEPFVSNGLTITTPSVFTDSSYSGSSPIEINTSHLTSENKEDNHNFTSKSFERAKNKLDEDQNIIKLHDSLSYTSKLGEKQVRDHVYTVNNIVMDGSVTSVLVEKALGGRNVPDDEFKKELATIASEVGVDFHNQFHSIGNDVVDLTTHTLLPEHLWKTTGRPEDAVAGAIYDKLRKFLTDFLKSQPVGSEIRFEYKIADPNYKWTDYDETTRKWVKKQGMGGAMDMIIFTPDGGIRLCDYKTTSGLSSEKGIPSWKIIAINTQLKAYKDILVRVYGFNENSFEQLRAFPINVIYNYKKENGKWLNTPKDVEIGYGDYVNKPNVKDYLDPVCADAERPKEKKLNDFLIKLSGIENKIKETVGVDSFKREELFAKREHLRKSINDLKLLHNTDNFKRQVAKIIEFAKEMFYESERSLEDLSDIDRHNLGVQLKVFSEMEESFPEALEKLHKISKDPSHDNYKESKELYNTIILFAKDANRLYKKFKAEAIRSVDNQIINVLRENPDRQEKSITFLQQYLTNLSRIPIQSIKLFFQHYSQAMSELKDISKEIDIKAEELSDKFKSFAKVKDGKDFFNAINKYFFPGGKPFTKFSKEFYEEKEKAEKTNDWKKMKELLIFNKKKYEESFKKYKEDKESIAKYHIDNLDDSLSGEEKKNKIEQIEKKKESDITKYREKNDIYFTSPEGNNPKAWLKSFFLKGNPAYHSSEYNFILNNQGLKDIYDAFEALNEKAISLGIKDYSSPFKLLEGVEASEAELSVLGIPSSKKLLDDFKINPEELDHITPTDPLTGQPVKTIGKPKFSGANIPTKDIFEAFKKISKGIAKYEVLSRIEGTALDLKTKESVRLVAPENKFGKTSNALGKQVAGIENMTNLETLNYFVNLLVYDENSNNWDNPINTPLGIISTRKVIETISKVFTLGKLGFSFTSFLSNYVGLAGNTAILVKMNEWFTSNHFFEGINKLAMRDEKTKLLLNYFNMGIGREEFDNHLTVSGIPKLKQKTNLKTFEELSMIGFKYGDDFWHATLQAASLFGKMIDEDNNFILIRDYLLKQPKYSKIFEKNTTNAELDVLNKDLDKDLEEYSKKYSIYSCAKVVDGKIVFVNPFTNKEFDPSIVKKGKILSEKTKHDESIKQLEKNIAGTKSETDPFGAGKNFLVSQFLTFRTWTIPLLRARYGAPMKQPEMDKLNWGYWSYFMGQFTKGRFVPMLEMLINQLSGRDFSQSMLESARTNYEWLKDKATKDGNNFDIDGNPYGVTFQQFVDRHRAMIAGMFRDLALIMATGMVLYAFKALASEDATPEEKYRNQYIARILQKFYNEFSFFADPREFQNTTSNLFPTVGILTDLWKLARHSKEYMLAEYDGDEEKLAKAHPGKYFVELFPGGRQYVDIMTYFDHDFGVAWGSAHVGQPHY